MPPLILIVAGILGGAALVRLATRESRRINRELDEARQAHVDVRDDAPTLRPDPDTGTYRPG
ncbi:hypothetical protein [Bradyrhizobium sp. SYSU BS000235]|uniref:hypothetical protein n=1 Tax=Bradyrhizobium sp. SYSU BS000235 TaxID=3411332 RepID=UPI003C75C0E8